MSMAVEYTGGHEGTHSVTLAKPIGGGVSDIQHVPLDQIELYVNNGYMPMDSDGLYPHTGYCINQPVTPGDADGVDCQPATVTPVLFKPAASGSVLPTATHQTATVADAHPPARLPEVGSPFLASFAMAFVITFVATLAAVYLCRLLRR